MTGPNPARLRRDLQPWCCALLLGIGNTIPKSGGRSPVKPRSARSPGAEGATPSSPGPADHRGVDLGRQSLDLLGEPARRVGRWDQPEPDSEPPEDVVPPSPDPEGLSPSSRLRYTELCFLLRRVCLGHSATVPGLHLPLLQRWLVAIAVSWIDPSVPTKRRHRTEVLQREPIPNILRNPERTENVGRGSE